MKTRSLLYVALAAVLAGCVEEAPLTAYHQPLTSPGGIFSTLPPAVQNSVRAQVGMAEIAAIHRHRDENGTIFEFLFKNPDVFPPLYVATDGSVLGPNITVAVGATPESIAASTGSLVGGLRLSELPPNVVLTIRREAPTAEVNTISRIYEGTDVFYEVTFKDAAHHPNMLIQNTGRLIQ
jgi:hypothetical protein